MRSLSYKIKPENYAKTTTSAPKTLLHSYIENIGTICDQTTPTLAWGFFSKIIAQTSKECEQGKMCEGWQLNATRTLDYQEQILKKIQKDSWK